MLKFLAGALAILMIIAGFAAIVKHSDFSDITVFISNIFEESSKAPAGDSSGSDSEDDSTGDTSEDTESKCYYFDSDLGVFCEIGLTQGLHHEYRYNCSCGMILFSDITFDHHCPDCGESISKENFISNPDYVDPDGPQSAYYRFDEVLCELVACTESEIPSYKYCYKQCSCGLSFYAKERVRISCPFCLRGIEEEDFVLNPDYTGFDSEAANKYYRYDDGLADVVEITEDQTTAYKYFTKCSCGVSIYAESDTVFLDCPNCDLRINDISFVLNPEFDSSANPDYDDSVDWESCSVYARCFDNSIDTFMDPMACFASERIYFQYMARCPGTSCNVVMLCDYAYDVVCPDCHVSIGETDFVLNSDWDGETVSYCCPLLYHHDGYSSERIDPLEGCPCGYEYQVQCSCGRTYCFYGEEDITVGCYYCEKQIWPDENTGDDSGDDPEDSVPYYYWDGAAFVACSKEYTANYYYYMEHDCGALYYWNTGDDPFGNCLYCENYIASYDIEVNPDYNG